VRAAVVSNEPAETPVRVAHVPTPDPRPGWVRVRLHRAALNRLDAMMVHTRLELDRPGVFGSDGAGVVDAVGGGVTGVEVGAEVVVSPSLWWGPDRQAPGPDYEILGSPTDGTHAEHVVVPAGNALPKPARLSMAEAAALPMAGLTAWRALVTRGRLAAGETVVVGAASSGVGTMAIQIATGLGARVVAVTSSADKRDGLRRLGADQVVLRTEPDLGDRLVAVTEGRADLALDPTGALWQPLLHALRPGGRLVAVGRMAAEIAEPRVQTVYWKQVDILGSSMGSPDDFRDLLAHVERSDWAPAIDSTYPLHAIRDAYARLDAPQRTGKVLLDVTAEGR
jgi:NADPH:quinone reductase-like Zn-dependent oxidoreductase